MVEKVLNLNREKTIFWMLLCILLLFAGMYIYLVRTTISNVVAREDLEKEASTLSLSIGDQEFEYISEQNSVTLTLAYSMGFKDNQNKTYISKNPSAKVAYLSN